MDYYDEPLLYINTSIMLALKKKKKLKLIFLQQRLNAMV